MPRPYPIKPRPKSMRMSEGKKRSVRESRVRPEINAARASDTKKRAAAKRKSLADNSSGQRRVAVAKKADPGSRGRKTTVIKGPKNARVTPRIVESGVGNVPMTLARLGSAIAKSVKPAAKPKAKPKAKPAKPKKIQGQTQNPKSGPGSGQRRNPIGPNMAKGKNSFTPAQKGQVTRNANKAKAIKDAKAADAAKAARAKAAAQKKAVAARNAKVTKAAPYAAAGAVAAGAGGMTMAARREKQQRAKSAEKGMVWNGSRYVKK